MIEKPIIGWREWVILPKLHIEKIKAKVDTGARTSSLHAFDLKYSVRAGEEYVSFKIHPIQKNSDLTVQCKAKVFDYRKIRSSNGQAEIRPVILVDLVLGKELWQIELTLTNRDEMGFRMLLGRNAIRKKFIIDPGKSYLGSKVNSKKKDKK